MYSRLLSTTVIAFAAASGFFLVTAAEGGDAGLGARDAVVVAQAAGYDPMRRPKPLPGPQKSPESKAERPEGNPELGGLPDAPGAEDTFYLCSACHSIALVKQQSLSDARWDYLWTWMIEQQGMTDPGEE